MASDKHGTSNLAEPQLMESSADWELEQQEWIEALAGVLDERGSDDAMALLARLQHELSQKGIVLTDAALNTPYKNTIPLTDQPPYPGDIELESRSEDILRWNAAGIRPACACAWNVRRPSSGPDGPRCPRVTLVSYVQGGGDRR